MIKRLRRPFAALFAALILMLAMPQTARANEAADASLAAINAKIAVATNYRVCFDFGGTQIPFDANTVATWFVNVNNVNAMKRQSGAYAGIFIVNGRETAFPAVTGVDNGFITDEAGNLIVSEKEMYATLAAVFKKYCAVPADLNAEFAVLKDAFMNHKQVNRVVYKAENPAPAAQPAPAAPAVTDKSKGTCIEISLAAQTLNYYIDGNLALSTPVVTGNVSRGMSTPTGTFKVYAKARNRTLRGPGYASFVNYWMPVVGGVGIHDASWRAQFGGNIYQTNGSHGCINVPPDVMPVIYEATAVGTPVIIY